MVQYSREELAARRRRLERRRRARIRGVALLAGVVSLVGLGVALASRGGSDAAPAISTSDDPAAPTTTQALEETSTEPAPTEDPPVEGKVTIAAVGDIAMGRDGFLPSGGPESLFAGVGGLLRGDVVLGNLEQALTDEGSSKCDGGGGNCFAFRTPP